jgi:hypothetical protein
MSILRQQAVSDLTCFRSEQIPYVWDKVQPLIQRALDRGSNYCLDDILEGLCNGSMQLWTYGDMQCALVTTIQKKGDTKYLLFLAMGGEDLHVWIKYLPLVEEWAKQHGCTEARIYGRAGWARHTGYTIEYTKMVKEI